MPITIKEIAQKANVSVATVSMVINNKPGIGSQTREKILNIVESCGYTVSPLKNSPTKNNGIIQLTIYKKHSQVVADTAFFESLIAGIESKSRLNGYQLTIKSISSNSLHSDSLQTDWNEDMIDGILLLGTEMDKADMLSITKIDKPVLVLDTCFLGICADYVVIDNINGAYMATTYLVEQSHKDIGYLKSSIDIQNFGERYTGYIQALADRNLTHDYKYTVKLRPTIEGAYEDMAAYLSNNPKLPTAFFADNDIIASGAMKALKENGIQIPKDVSIVGFDDMPFCTITEPQLTTISVDKKALGELAVESLAKLISGKKDYHLKTVLGVELISRDSVVSPALSGI